MTHKHFTSGILFALLVISLPGGTQEAAAKVSLLKNSLNNESANIPVQCYTKTKDGQGKVLNPCYVCHTKSTEPNYTNDHRLQLEYSFPESARSNPWTNIFQDRRAQIAAISNHEILSYIRTSNYLGQDGTIIPAERLKDLPTSWDYNKNDSWDGYLPDCTFNFDGRGFDRTATSGYTGWRAFAYHLFPTSYWPTNGAADDVMIRLPVIFQEKEEGLFDRLTYEINLAIVEALITQKDVAIDPVDEKLFGIDLNLNGSLDTAVFISYHWPASQGKKMSYVGVAGRQLSAGKTQLAAGLFPVGTEFLHSIRYLDISDDKNITPSARMKELQYMKKQSWQSYAALEEGALSEMKERDDFPDRTSQFIGDSEHGVFNGKGWLLQGFIEDAAGDLRPQSYEETVSCVGCHGGIGVTTDSTFAFSRKFTDGEGIVSHGWFHWRNNFLHNVAEPKTELYGAGVFYEYSYYLMYNPSGNDLGDNQEVISKFKTADGFLDNSKLLQLQNDVSPLLLPSPERAMQLNKAYRTLVTEQDFIHGREANIEPLASVHREITAGQLTEIAKSTSPVTFGNHFGCFSISGNNSVPARISKKERAEVFGRSLVGPDGRFYGASWDGTIQKSSYQSAIEGARMVFPDRLTLPTRPIIPTSGNPGCALCHRQLDGKTAAEEMAKDGRKQLTGAGSSHTARFSPDGDLIAYVSDRSGSEQIWLMDKNGGHQLQLTDGQEEHSWPNWSRDSRQLVYISHDPQAGSYKLKRYTLGDRSEQTLVSSDQMINRPVFHPRLPLLAYSAKIGDNWDIWLVSLEDGQKMRLTNAADMESNPLWSPDGSILAYKTAPADQQYSLTRQNFLTFADGFDHLPTVHSWQGPESVQMNDWSPDGSKITYTAEIISGVSGQERVSYAALISDLAVGENNAETKKTVIASQGQTLGDRGPVFSPDNRFLAFWAWNRDMRAGLWLYDLKRGQAFALTAGGFDMYPQWSPDGKTILFESRIGGKSQLMSLQVDTSPSGLAQKLAYR